MKQDRKPNLRTQKVTVVFSDPWHKLHLVEVTTSLRMYPGEECFHYRVDRKEVEATARVRLPEPENEWTGFDFVGVLVAHDDPLARGRITWAEEVETQAAVEV
jgi:hypothetical protein